MGVGTFHKVFPFGTLQISIFVQNFQIALNAAHRGFEFVSYVVGHFLFYQAVALFFQIGLLLAFFELFVEAYYFFTNNARIGIGKLKTFIIYRTLFDIRSKTPERTHYPAEFIGFVQQKRQHHYKEDCQSVENQIFLFHDIA
ncbi:MAG: hypothetical protein BWX77_00777 [Bacteroidetes bacterium ADurb.Bin090]|nr:MAG: hypothetical protein BWX77_00777 [Bacteroidetes bacterium ADurb.Bin090]